MEEIEGASGLEDLTRALQNLMHVEQVLPFVETVFVWISRAIAFSKIEGRIQEHNVRCLVAQATKKNQRVGSNNFAPSESVDSACRLFPPPRGTTSYDHSAIPHVGGGRPRDPDANCGC
jgi:hypothetical protein